MKQLTQTDYDKLKAIKALGIDLNRLAAASYQDASALYATLYAIHEKKNPILGFVDSPDSPASDASTSIRPIVFNSDQRDALNFIKKWLDSDSQFCALRGAAGTGKTTVVKHIVEWDYNFHCSAPSNKASKVLSDSIGKNVKTTYSLLGARMEQVEDKLVLKVSHAPDLGRAPILIIDEAWTVPTILLDILKSKGYRCLFIGDHAQLNPVGELVSPVGKLTKDNRVTLRKVERFDNQLLKASVAIRRNMRDKVWKSPLVDDNDGSEGVFLKTRKAFERMVTEVKLEEWDTTKMCVWRNKTVDSYTQIIREALGFEDEYEIGERILLASPLMDEGNIVAYVDEDFVIQEMGERVISLHGADIETRVLQVGRGFSLNVPVAPDKFRKHLDRLAGLAERDKGESRKKAWRRFWEFKERFSEIRYGYCLTAHRLQGTTVNNILLDQADILANPTKQEALRALYVGATRPKHSLVTF